MKKAQSKKAAGDRSIRGIRVSGTGPCHNISPEEELVRQLAAATTVMECGVCGLDYIESSKRVRAWGNSGKPYEPTDWLCQDCRRSM